MEINVEEPTKITMQKFKKIKLVFLFNIIYLILNFNFN